MRVRSLSTFVILTLVPWIAAQDERPLLDLTSEGAVARGVAEATIIDTARFQPQIQFAEPWPGPTELVRDHIPVHWRDKKLAPGPRPILPMGGLTGARRTETGALFPGIGQTRWRPPDPALAVGPQHIVQTVNMRIAWFTKDGTLQFAQNLDSTGNPGFFDEVGAGNFTFDPKCYYDQHSERFVVVALEVYRNSSEAWITIAVSDDSDPNGIWYKYRTWAVVNVGDTTYWVDYPGFGYDRDAFYITGNLFRLNGNGSGFGNVLFRVFDKFPLLSGAPAEFVDMRDARAASVQAAHHFGDNSAAYFVSVENQSALRINAIVDPVGAPSLVSTTVAVPQFQRPSTGAPNLGGGTLSVLDGRTMTVQWRDGNLYVAHGVRTVSSSRNRVRWYHLNTNDWPQNGNATLEQSGQILGGSGMHTWFPALMQNRHGDVGVVMARSSSTTYADIVITGRKASDPAGTMGQLTSVAIGTAGSSGRWGDYFDIAIDPLDDSTFWVVGEYAESSGWATWISSFVITPAKGDLNCDGAVDTFDIEPFLMALFNPDDYEMAFPDCDISAADTNDDGAVDAFDIEPFLDILF